MVYYFHFIANSNVFWMLDYIMINGFRWFFTQFLKVLQEFLASKEKKCEGYRNNSFLPKNLNLTFLFVFFLVPFFTCLYFIIRWIDWTCVYEYVSRVQWSLVKKLELKQLKTRQQVANKKLVAARKEMWVSKEWF